MPLFVCDVRGIGESRPSVGARGSFEHPFGSDYLCASFSLMLDGPSVGQKTLDVIRVFDWLAKYDYTDVHLVAKGWGAIPATFAAVLDKRVSLKNALTSYADVPESEEYHWPLSAFVPSVLAHFDLPDCYRALRSKQLRQIAPWGAMAGE